MTYFRYVVLYNYSTSEVICLTVYIDILIILNLYINYFLLRCSALFLRRAVSNRRLFAAALLGSLGSMIILAPALPFYITIPYKILLGAAIVLVAFGKQKIKDFLICELFFLLVGFLFGGILTAVWTLFSPAGMLLNNGVCFFNIPIAALVSFTAGAYFLMKLVKLLSDKHKQRFCTVKIMQNHTEITLRGLCDTGCEIRDVFSGKPVIICDFVKAAEILPDEILEYLSGNTSNIEKIRLIPCRTVSSSAAIPVFKAQSVIVDGKQTEAMIGVSKERLGDNIDCIFNPKIIPI